MKKILVIAALLLAGFSASAQVHIGAGYMWDFWAQKQGSNKAGTINMNGVYAGASYNIQVVEGLGIAPGAYFSWATGIDLDKDGKKVEGDLLGISGKYGHTHMALTIPVHVTYSMDLGAGKAFAYLGPAFQYGLSLKSFVKASTSSSEGKKVSENLFAKDEDGNRVYSPFDVKLGVGFGYTWKFIQANVGFDFGFLDRDPLDNFKANANAVHAGIAFVF